MNRYVILQSVVSRAMHLAYAGGLGGVVGSRSFLQVVRLGVRSFFFSFHDQERVLNFHLLGFCLEVEDIVE